MPWTDQQARALIGKAVRALTDLHAPRGTTGQITDTDYGDVSGWLCCIRWIDGSFTWIGQDDEGVSVAIEQ